MKKRLLSALLALVMVLALLPASVFADGDTTPQKTAAEITINIQWSGTTGWKTGDKVVIEAAGKTVDNVTTNAFSVTATYSDGKEENGDDENGVDENSLTRAAEGWTISQNPAGYTAAFTGTVLTLTSTTPGATGLKAEDFGKVTATATLADTNGTAPIASNVTPSVQDGSDGTTPGGAGGSGSGTGTTNPTDIVDPTTSPTHTAGSAQLTKAATYIQKNDEGKDIAGAPGYFVKETVGSVTTYYKVTNGFIVNGKYESSAAVTKTTGNNIVAIGSGTITVAAGVNTLNVDVYGTSCSVSISGTDLRTVNIKDTKYTVERNLGLRQSNHTIRGLSGWTTGREATLTMENVDTTDSISMSGYYAHTVRLTNASVGGITLDGSGVDSKYNHVCKAQTITVNSEGGNVVRKSSLGAISVKGDSSSVTLTDASATSITLDGHSTKLSVNSMVYDSTVGSVTLTDHLDKKDLNKTLSTVTVKGVVDSITANSSAKSGKVKVDVQAGGKVGGAIDLQGASDIAMTADVDVTAATVGGTITVEGGTVDVGSNATITGLTMSGVTTFRVNGSSNTVNNINTGSGNQVTMTILADSTNKFGIASGTGLDNYTKANILGGMWNYAVPAVALSPTIDFQLRKDGTDGTDYRYGYYPETNLASALTDQGTSANSALTCTKVGLGGDTYPIVFMNGKDVWGEMWVRGGVQFKLPAQVNTVTVTRWTDLWRSYTANASYTTPALDALPSNIKTGAVGNTGTEKWQLNAGGGITNGDITKFTSVTVSAGAGAWATYSDNMGTVKGTLNGSVITLTGAVPSGVAPMTLKLYTDAVEEGTKADGTKYDKPVVLEVGVSYDSAKKSLTFANVATDLGHGATLQTVNGIDVLRLSNGTTYTLNGTGLKERASQIKVANTGNNHTVEASAKGVSTLRTPAAQNAVVGLINGSYGTDNGSTKFDWSQSPAMAVAVNAALATITDQQVESWRNAAQRAAWDKLNTGTFSQADAAALTQYTEVFLVPYLQVNLTNYVEGSTATATLVPSWRVEVRQPTAVSNKYSTIFYDADDPSKPANAYIAKQGTSLGQLTGEFGEVKINTNNFFKDTKYYMHQDNTYAYQYDATNGYVITHAGTGGNGLGTMVISTDVPLVQRLNKKDGGTVVAYYDTLQAAVDDAKDGQHINVDQSYKGSTSITVTGDARKFTIQANGNNVVVANASGGLVEWNGNGSEYTVQLNRDATAVVDGSSATIVVSRVANGTATVNATTAKVNSTVTVTCTPAVGYRTNTVSASAHMTKTNTNVAVIVTKVSDNVYSFKVPEGADSVTVTPAFVVGTAAAIPFTDVAVDHWAYNSVKYVYDNGLMNGVNTAGTQFGGNQNLTRAMVVTILYRAAGSPFVGTSTSFSDVANNTWYSQAVAWANQNGIVTGYANGTFQPNWNITRQELATILYRYNTNYKGRATTGSTTLANFPDQGSVSNWATAGMQWAVGNGIVNGITNGVSTSLSPAGSATRYEAATMLMRYGQGMGL